MSPEGVNLWQDGNHLLLLPCEKSKAMGVAEIFRASDWFDVGNFLFKQAKQQCPIKLTDPLDRADIDLGIEKAPASRWKGPRMNHRSSMSHFSTTDPLGAEKGVYAFCDLLGEQFLNTSASHH